MLSLLLSVVRLLGEAGGAVIMTPSSTSSTRILCARFKWFKRFNQKFSYILNFFSNLQRDAVNYFTSNIYFSCILIDESTKQIFQILEFQTREEHPLLLLSPLPCGP